MSRLEETLALATAPVERFCAGLCWFSICFCLGHFKWYSSPARLAVMVPALVFGGSTANRIVVPGRRFHALCNLFSESCTKVSSDRTSSHGVRQLGHVAQLRAHLMVLCSVCPPARAQKATLEGVVNVTPPLPGTASLTASGPHAFATSWPIASSTLPHRRGLARIKGIGRKIRTCAFTAVKRTHPKDHPPNAIRW